MSRSTFLVAVCFDKVKACSISVRFHTIHILRVFIHTFISGSCLSVALCHEVACNMKISKMLRKAVHHAQVCPWWTVSQSLPQSLRLLTTLQQCKKIIKTTVFSSLTYISTPPEWKYPLKSEKHANKTENLHVCPFSLFVFIYVMCAQSSLHSKVYNNITVQCFSYSQCSMKVIHT